MVQLNLKTLFYNEKNRTSLGISRKPNYGQALGAIRKKKRYKQAQDKIS
jgi:hypothetical protein